MTAPNRELTACRRCRNTRHVSQFIVSHMATERPERPTVARAPPLSLRPQANTSASQYERRACTVPARELIQRERRGRITLRAERSLTVDWIGVERGTPAKTR